MDALENALAEFKHALMEFIALLEREAEALKEGRTHDLGALITEKADWSESANTAWNRLIVAGGIDVTRGDSIDATLAADPRLHGSWSDARRLVERAERLNHDNGLLIEAQLQRTRQALDVLQTAANRGALYGANGRIVDGFQSGHTLDKV
ncbi:flagella synthesis protein FlgN [Parasulfuritortus cantonensis]|nr:flagellar protein FlgN [Parasulfuritortus cantonensis]